MTLIILAQSYASQTAFETLFIELQFDLRYSYLVPADECSVLFSTYSDCTILQQQNAPSGTLVVSVAQWLECASSDPLLPTVEVRSSHLESTWHLLSAYEPS